MIDPRVAITAFILWVGIVMQGHAATHDDTLSLFTAAGSGACIAIAVGRLYRARV